MRWVIAFCGAALLLWGCGAAQSTSSSGVTSNEIVVSEMSASVAGLSAYDLITRHNSTWLRKRGASSFNNPNPIQVYLDNTGSPYGTVEVLREIRAVNVASIRHFDSQEAQFKFGLGNVSGAILVTTRSGNE